MGFDSMAKSLVMAYINGMETENILETGKMTP